MKWILYLVLAPFFVGGVIVHADTKLVRLGSSTSLKASGLLAVLQPVFEKDTGYHLEVQATGSGKAIQLAREGKFDILIVHAPGAEQELIGQGYAEKRIPFMRNYFLIVGPSRDPAQIKDTGNAAESFRHIAASKSLFISRADDSGTHRK